MDINGPDSVSIIACFFTSRNPSTYEVLQVRNSTGLTITNNIFDNSGAGIEIQSTASALFQRNIAVGLNLSNCTIMDNVIFSGNFSSPGSIVTNNIFTGAATWYQNDNMINVDQSSIFVGYPTQGSYSFDARYKLSPGSPATGYAVDGGDCGALAGTHRYKLSGIPDIPLIYYLKAVDLSITENDSLTVNIKIRSEN
jgi:parallel beta-helix repeat protein